MNTRVATKVILKNSTFSYRYKKSTLVEADRVYIRSREREEKWKFQVFNRRHIMPANHYAILQEMYPEHNDHVLSHSDMRRSDDIIYNCSCGTRLLLTGMALALGKKKNHD